MSHQRKRCSAKSESCSTAADIPVSDEDDTHHSVDLEADSDEDLSVHTNGDATQGLTPAAAKVIVDFADSLEKLIELADRYKCFNNQPNNAEIQTVPEVTSVIAPPPTTQVWSRRR